MDDEGRQALDRLLRDALIARAERLGLDASTIRSPAPGALVARRFDGSLLRIDFRTYAAQELSR